jgi:hypothetical protein
VKVAPRQRYIRVRELFPGTTPEYIRESLVGLVFPVVIYHATDKPKIGDTHGSLRGLSWDEVYPVNASDLISVLKKAARTGAVIWFEEFFASGKFETLYLFEKKYCDLLP